MANLTAWKFDSPDGASQAVRTLKELQDEGLIVIDDAAIVEWPQGKKKPKTRQVDDMTGAEGARRRVLGLPVRNHLLRPADRRGRRCRGRRNVRKTRPRRHRR